MYSRNPGRNPGVAVCGPSLQKKSWTRSCALVPRQGVAESDTRRASALSLAPLRGDCFCSEATGPPPGLPQVTVLAQTSETSWKVAGRKQTWFSWLPVSVNGYTGCTRAEPPAKGQGVGGASGLLLVRLARAGTLRRLLQAATCF